MATTSEFRPGLIINLKETPFSIVQFQRVKPGKGGAFFKTRLKNLKTGAVSEKSFRSGEKVEIAYIEEKRYEYLYRDGALFHFLDQDNLEELALTELELGSAVHFLKENMTITIRFHKGDVVGVNLPTLVNLAVKKTEPGVRGNTATGAAKPAELETGITIQVPLFVNEGDMVAVDTRSSEYAERVK